MQTIYPYGYFQGFRKTRDRLGGIIEHPKKEEIERRIKTIAFFDKYGATATKEAFEVSRSTVYCWKKKLKDGQGKILSLAPGSRAPKRKRKREIDLRIISFIKDYRTIHPGVGKETIKP